MQFRPWGNVLFPLQKSQRKLVEFNLNLQLLNLKFNQKTHLSSETKVALAHLLDLLAVEPEPADVDVLDGLLLQALLECRVHGGEQVQEVGARLRRVKLEGGRVVLRRHHDEPRQGNLIDNEK